MKTQYQIEKEQAIKDGKDLEQFEKDWHSRAVDAYLENKESIHDFRSGEIHIK